MKSSNLFAAAIVAVTAFTAVSCGKSSETKKASADADSIVEKPTQTVIERLPDTIYPSAQKIEFKVDVKLQDIDGRIENLTDLYADAPGAFTFRRGAFRQADFGGRLDSVQTRFEIN